MRGHSFTLSSMKHPGMTVVVAAIMLLTGCAGGHRGEDAGSPPIPRPDAIPTATISANADPWETSATAPDKSGHVYLGNGYVGFQIGPLGSGDGENGPLLCLVAGAYDGDKLRSLPHPAMYSIKCGNDLLTVSSSLTGYRQALQMHDGTLTTTFTWQTGGKSIPITVATFASRSNPHLTVVHITSTTEEKLTAATTSGGSGPGISGGITVTSGSSNSPTVAMAQSTVNGNGRGFEWTSYSLLYTSDDSPDPGKVAQAQVSSLTADSYAKILADHEAAWHTLWNSDITIDGDPASQQMVHAALFYLLESTRAGSKWSIPPMGLSNDAWGGHIFWDAPMWMFPALILLHPAEARPMVDYAVRMLPQAQKLASVDKKDGASYPWESGRSGGEAAVQPFAQERHVTADVANMMWHYYRCTGDKGWLRQSGYPVLRSTADYWISRISRDPDGSLHIRKVVGPDETAEIVDDDAFTRGVVKVNLLDAAAAASELGEVPRPEWQSTAEKLKISFDSATGVYPAFHGYKGDPMKQADPELLIYPLNLVTDSKVIGKMLEYYPSRVESGGPAMTDSIYATIAAREGMGEEALKFFKQSYEPFLVPPFDQISEKHSHVRQYCFVTGLGGLLQSVIYGFGGLSDNGKTLAANPHLPSGWTALRITGLHYHGQTYNLSASPGQAGILEPVKPTGNPSVKVANRAPGSVGLKPGAISVPSQSVHH